MTPGQAVSDLVSCGFLDEVSGDPCDMVGRPGPEAGGWQPIAQALSIVFPGAFCWPTKHGVTVNRGPNVLLRIVTPEYHAASAGPASLVSSLVGRQVPRNAGVAARMAWDWIGPRDRPNAAGDAALLHNGRIPRYHSCQPGKGTVGVLHDIRRCYPQIMRRLPSLRARVTSDRVFFVPFKPDERARLADLYAAMEQDELLRRYAWGTALGGEPGAKIPLFVAGEKRQHTVPAGPFRTGALLVARMAWELTRAAATETGAVYANTDCVIIPGPASLAPAPWRAVGVESAVKASGDYDIIRYCVYRVGDYATIPYRAPVGDQSRPKRYGYGPDPERWFYPSILA